MPLFRGAAHRHRLSPKLRVENRLYRCVKTVCIAMQKTGIVEEEARIVRLIYSYYIEGYSSPAIANALTRAGVPTITGQNTVWNSNSVLYILRNEKYCGDVAMQKTYIEDYLTHKAVKNTGKVQAYLLHNHHEPIISKRDWELVQDLLANWKTRLRKKPSVQKKVMTVRRGRFAGYIIIDPTWTQN